MEVKILGGGAKVTSFSDSFIRASGAPGRNWLDHTLQRSPFVAPFGYVEERIGACTDAIQGLIWSYDGAGAPATIAPLLLVSMPLWANVWGRTQFSQVTFVGEINPSGVNEAGPAVLIDAEGGNPLLGETWYGLAFENNAAPSVNRYNGTVRTAIIPVVAGGAPVLGDIYRLSATPVAGATALVVTKNGAVVNTATDGAGSLLTGIPGMFGFAMTPTGQLQMRSWTGGVGL